MKKLLSFFLITLMSLFLIGCSNTPESVCKDFFKEITSVTGNRLIVYLNENKIITSGKNIPEINDVFENTLKNFKFEITNTEITDDMANIKVNVTGVNFGDLTNTYLIEVYEKLNEGEALKDKLTDNSFMTSVENQYLHLLDSAMPETREITIPCIKQNDVWTLNNPTKILDDIFGIEEPQQEEV